MYKRNIQTAAQATSTVSCLLNILFGDKWWEYLTINNKVRIQMEISTYIVEDSIWDIRMLRLSKFIQGIFEELDDKRILETKEGKHHFMLMQIEVNWAFVNLKSIDNNIPSEVWDNTFSYCCWVGPFANS